MLTHLTLFLNMIIDHFGLTVICNEVQLFVCLFVLEILMQSVTSRLETSRYRDFSQFFESIGIGLENI